MDFTIGIVSRNLTNTRISSNSETVGVGTFFEASRFGCCKTIFDVTKVTYNMYSYDTFYMSREIMETDVRDCATYQNLSKGDIYVII